MAHGSKNILETIQGLNIFGDVKESDIETVETEEKERERIFNLKKKQREEEYKKMEEERRLQEIEDEKFAREEQKRLEREFIERQSSKPILSAGRARDLAQYKEEKDSLKIGRGRAGRGNASITTRENQISNNIHQVMGEATHSNQKQILIWHGDQLRKNPSPSSSSSQSTEQFEDACSSSSSLFKQSSYFENAVHLSNTSSSSSSPSFNQRLGPVPTSLCRFSDQLKESIPSTGINFTHGRGFSHLPSSSTSSAHSTNLDPFPPLQSPRHPVRKPQSRIAARFSNMPSEKEDDASNKPQEQDSPTVLMSTARPLVPSSIRRGGGEPINDLRPSERLTDSELIRLGNVASDSSHTADTRFRLNPDDFPAL